MKDEEQVYLIRQVVAALRAGGIEAEVVRMWGGTGTEVVITLPGIHFLTAENTESAEKDVGNQELGN